eukprot:352785-Chlamydomonas_euryale.AAC.10
MHMRSASLRHPHLQDRNHPPHDGLHTDRRPQPPEPRHTHQLSRALSASLGRGSRPADGTQPGRASPRACLTAPLPAPRPACAPERTGRGRSRTDMWTRQADKVSRAQLARLGGQVGCRGCRQTGGQGKQGAACAPGRTGWLRRLRADRRTREVGVPAPLIPHKLVWLWQRTGVSRVPGMGMGMGMAEKCGQA